MRLTAILLSLSAMVFTNSRIDPQTKRVTGPIMTVEEAIGKRKWKAEYRK
jgi:hypothetical protein